nr:MAG TPA: hypothetical protein [Bacteriophage sp.]
MQPFLCLFLVQTLFLATNTFVAVNKYQSNI